MTEEELKQLDMQVYDEISRIQQQKENEVKAYVDGMRRGLDMTIKAIKNYLKNDERKEHNDGNRA